VHHQMYKLNADICLIECHLRVQGFVPVCSCAFCVVVYVPVDGWAQKTNPWKRTKMLAFEL